jgi:hypothetical protein
MIHGLEKKERPPGRSIQVPGALGEMAVLQFGHLAALVNQLAVLEFARNELIAVQQDSLIFLGDVFENGHDCSP